MKLLCWAHVKRPLDLCVFFENTLLLCFIPLMRFGLSIKHFNQNYLQWETAYFFLSFSFLRT